MWDQGRIKLKEEEYVSADAFSGLETTLKEDERRNIYRGDAALIRTVADGTIAL